jgi:hypothetical protein
MAFSEPVGIDRRGRWIFRKPQRPGTLAATSPVTAPATTSTADVGDFLVIDPTIPDPTPRLPVWTYSTAETVGWDKDNWPAVKRGGAWALVDDDWRPMKRTEQFYTDPNVPPAAIVAPATATVSTAPSTTTTSTAPVEDLGPVLLVDRDGGRYYDGRTRLVVAQRDGTRVDWPLPASATGSIGKVHLAQTAEGLLFLYNQPGRLLRIRPTPDEEQPLHLEATFTRNVPNTEEIVRMWVDPSDRLILAHGTKLSIMFPRGYIPPAIITKIPPAQLVDEE